MEPMLKDTVNYVRQGAQIAMALILVQQNEVTAPKVCCPIWRQFKFPLALWYDGLVV